MELFVVCGSWGPYGLNKVSNLVRGSGSHRSEHSGGRIWKVIRRLVEGSIVIRRAYGGEVVRLMQKHRT